MGADQGVASAGRGAEALRKAPVDAVVMAIAAQFEAVLSALGDPDADPIDAVHRARKALKRGRGLLRLIKVAVGRSGFRTLNKRLRDIARILAPVRDAAIRLETFEANRPRLAERVAPDILAETHECLLGEHGAAYPDGRVDPAVLPEVQEEVEKAQRTLTDLRSRLSGRYEGEAGFDVLAQGLLHAFEAARSGMGAAATSGDFNEFHEWRKEVKYLRFQLEHLEPLRPGGIRDLIDRLEQIDTYLGDAHDLWMLGNFTEAHPDCCEDRDLRETFIGAMDGRRHVLNGRALRVGTPLFAEEPKSFMARMEGYWAEADRI